MMCMENDIDIEGVGCQNGAPNGGGGWYLWQKVSTDCRNNISESVTLNSRAKQKLVDFERKKLHKTC